MANTLQIKRSTGSSAPSSLSAGELAYAQGSDRLYIGHTDGSTVMVVGGAGSFLRSDANDTLTGNLTVTGTLTVQGSTTTIESNTLTIGDNKIVLNNDETGTPSADAGVEIERGTSDNALMQWKEDGDIFEFKVGSAYAPIKATNATLTGNLDVDGTTNLDNTDIDGTFAVDGTTISLDATTSLNIDNSNTSNGITLGTATSGVPISIGHTTSETTVNDNLTVTGTLTASSTLSVATSLNPDASDGASLGTSALEWSDLFLADGAVVSFGDDQEVTLTHVADTGLLLSSTDQLQFGDSGTYIHQSADGVLDLVSDTEIEINATTIDINGNADVSGTLTCGGAFTSLGIDDNCSAERLQLADSSIAIMASGVTLSGYGSGTSTLDKFVVDGGTF